jgi:acetyl esterase/lipase
MAVRLPSDFKLPGRATDPQTCLATDPRANRKLAEGLKAIGLDQNVPDVEGITSKSTLDEIRPLMAETEKNLMTLYNNAPIDLPTDASEPEVEWTEKVVKGMDGNDISLWVVRKKGSEGQVLPGVVYIHGGGMVYGWTRNKIHDRWLKSIALAGAVAIGLDFRNAYMESGHYPFPCGLNDCASGVQWIAKHKSELGINKIVLQGESGGGNLCLATALKGLKEGWLSGTIDGVYACCPFISNLAYLPASQKISLGLLSFVENDNYFINSSAMDPLGRYYTPNDADWTNPLAWPWHAKVEELRGLSKHFLSMDELDPLRDEGLQYARKLSEAGVDVTWQVNGGVVHGTNLGFRKWTPEVHWGVVEGVVGFARRV